MEINMSQIKKYGPDANDPNLKREDQKKSYDNGGSGVYHGIDFIGGKRITDKSAGANVKVKKKLPLAVDIIAGIIMLALVLGVIVGSYMLFRYYSNDYETRNVTYTVVFNVEDEINKYASMKNGELYMDVDGNAVYFGKIISTPEKDAELGRVTLEVNASVKYKKDEGYSIGDNRLAVGSEYKLRWLEKTLSMSVVELGETGGK